MRKLLFAALILFAGSAEAQLDTYSLGYTMDTYGIPQGTHWHDGRPFNPYGQRFIEPRTMPQPYVGRALRDALSRRQLSQTLPGQPPLRPGGCGWHNERYVCP